MKPWMRLREGETEQERNGRLTRTCCWCGRQDTDFPASDAHEMRCESRPGIHRPQVDHTGSEEP
ncbi:hypothetical protein FHR81_002466 [Actinoalloteichus hoggarensis]|uniref:Uncharacterized protein n=1 Tax=Actinoalloteichus hoggarensis TaxID=1470176 RepID=A0A221VWY8_9PSEU|nr:hypothetical protein AHOG_02025 [Actinoalloteichus hoggarensis]MBB5921426.1 hypothetical protein [Actinoalloteichus hoggarensis]